MKPILFNTEMVRAILEGRKTQTRRLIKGDALYNLEIDTDGNKRTLRVENTGCPEFAECSQKSMNIASEFFINYCPNCGARMDGDAG